MTWPFLYRCRYAILAALLLYLQPAVLLEIVHVKDGVVVQERGTVHAQSGDVTLYVTIPLPDESQYLGEFRSIVGSTQNTVIALETWQNNTQIHVGTIDLLKKRVARMVEFARGNRRARRALLDIFGTLSKALFGTATEADVQLVRSMVDNLAQEQTKLVTAHNQMVGTVNHVITELNNLNEFVAEISQGLDYLKLTIPLLTNITLALDRTLQLEGMISWLEDAEHDIGQALDKQKRRIDHCQGGIVSEELVPNSFNDLRKELGVEKVLPNSWYYQNLKVDYYFEDRGAVVCKIQVPTIHDEQYLLYQINTFPVRKDDLVLRVYHDVQVAIGTSNGLVFYADNCMGQQPQVCHPGLVLDRDQESCVRAMAHGSDQGKQSCPVHVSTIDRSHSLMGVGRNLFAVYMKDVSYSYRCPGERNVLGDLVEGLYVILLEARCVFDTQEWFLEGMEHRTHQSTLNLTQVQFPTFPELSLNWTVPVKQYMAEEGINEHKVEKIEFVPTVAPPPPMSTPPFFSSTTLSIMWGAIAFILLIFILFCCFGDQRFRNPCSKRIQRRTHRDRKIILPETIELGTIKEDTKNIQTDPEV